MERALEIFVEAHAEEEEDAADQRARESLLIRTRIFSFLTERMWLWQTGTYVLYLFLVIRLILYILTEMK